MTEAGIGGVGGGGVGGGGAWPGGHGGAINQQMHLSSLLQPPVFVPAELNLSEPTRVAVRSNSCEIDVVRSGSEVATLSQNLPAHRHGRRLLHLRRRHRRHRRRPLVEPKIFSAAEAEQPSTRAAGRVGAAPPAAAGRKPNHNGGRADARPAARRRHPPRAWADRRGVGRPRRAAATFLPALTALVAQLAADPHFLELDREALAADALPALLLLRPYVVMLHGGGLLLLARRLGRQRGAPVRRRRDFRAGCFWAAGLRYELGAPLDWAEEWESPTVEARGACGAVPVGDAVLLAPRALLGRPHALRQLRVGEVVRCGVTHRRAPKLNCRRRGGPSSPPIDFAAATLPSPPPSRAPPPPAGRPPRRRAQLGGCATVAALHLARASGVSPSVTLLSLRNACPAALHHQVDLDALAALAF